MKSGIYQILNKTNNHSYIGSAINLKSRFATHRNRLKNKNHHSIYLQRAYNKYGLENFEFKVLEYCDKPVLISKEQWYLEELNPEYNICKIAGSCLGIKFSKESNLKKSLNHAFKGKYGKNHPSSKEVFQYSENGKFIKKWENAVQIEKKLKFDSGNIRKSIKNRWMFYGYFWSYKYFGKNYKDIPKKKDRTKTKKPISQYTLDGIFIRDWDSAKEATNYLKTKEGNLNGVLKNKTKTAYGYIWKYKKLD